MRSIYRRKRIPSLPADSIRALDDEFAALERAINSLISAVADDTTPVLRGPLRTNGHPIIITNTDGVEVGRLENIPGTEGVFLAQIGPDGIYRQEDAGITLLPGKVRLTGTTAGIASLASSDYGDVWATQDGDLYLQKPPSPGWVVTDTDTGVYALSESWVALTDLFVVTPEIITAGSRWDYTSKLFIVNSGQDDGVLDLSPMLGSEPPDGNSVTSITIAANFSGYVSFSGWSIAAADIAINSEIKVWAKMQARSSSQFLPSANGSLSSDSWGVGNAQAWDAEDVVLWTGHEEGSIYPHELSVSVPA